jgi:hypothetical protein
MALRVTRQYDEILAAGDGEARVTRQYVEILTPGDGEARVTRQYTEILANLPVYTENITHDLGLSQQIKTAVIYDIAYAPLIIDEGVVKTLLAGKLIETSGIIAPMGDEGGSDTIILPTGPGNIISSLEGASSRGGYNVDLQLYRLSDTQITLGDKSSILGGACNEIDGDYATILGGYYNLITADFTAILNGYDNQTDADYSVVQGKQTLADHYGENAHASGQFSTKGDAQESILVARCETDGAISEELFLDGHNQRITLSNDDTWFFKINVVARRTDSDGHGAWEIKGLIERSLYITSIVGTNTTWAHGSNPAGWNISVTAANDALTITATGATGHKIRWVAKVELIQVSGPEEFYG